MLPSGEDDERVCSEMYNSDVFLDEHDRAQLAPTDDPSCEREKVAAGLMFWLDVVRILQPSVQLRCGPYTCFLATSQNISDANQTLVQQNLDTSRTFLLSLTRSRIIQRTSILAHRRRELMHAVWKFLLDDDFLHI
jgi:hypothetical protein